MVRVVVAEASRVKREVSTLAVHLLLPPLSLSSASSPSRSLGARDEKTSRPSSRSPSVLASHANLFDARHNDRFPSPPTRSRGEETWRRNSRLHNCMYIYIYVHLYVKCNEDASRGRNRNVSTIGQWKFAKDTDGIDGIETNER